MLPKNETDLSAAEITEMPSLTYILNIGEQTIQEMTDGLDAVRQAVQLILAAERYEYAIFSWTTAWSFKICSAKITIMFLLNCKDE